MHRLNAWQITAFPERQESNKWYKKAACFAFFIIVPAKLVVEWKERHNGYAVVQLCVCQARREDQREWRPNTSDVVSDFIHSTWRESERQSTVEGRKGEKVWTYSPSHWQDWVTPPSFNTNQSQTCQLDSTCTFPAWVPSSAYLWDKFLFLMASHRTQMLALRHLTSKKLSF